MNIIKKTFLIVLCLLVLIVTIILAKAHWQIAQVEPTLPSWAQINSALDAPNTEANNPISVQYINTSEQTTPMGKLSHPSIIITWPNDRRLLIDTGMQPEAAARFAAALETLGSDKPIIYSSVAMQLAEQTESVKAVVFTHMHEDHTDGLSAICNLQTQPATVYQTSQQSKLTNHTTQVGMNNINNSTCASAVIDQAHSNETPVKKIPNFPGLVAISLGGHTPGSTLYALRINLQTLLFSGDITNSLHDLVNDQPKHVLYSLLVVPENTRRTEQLRAWLLELNNQANVSVLPAHDLAAMQEAGISRWAVNELQLQRIE